MQKNIVYGNITAGGSVHIGDNIYVIERDFPYSILFLRVKKEGQGYEAMLSVKSVDDTAIQLFQETLQLPVSEDLFKQAEDFQNQRRGWHENLRSDLLAGSPESRETLITESIYQTFFSGDIGTVCRDFLDLLQTNKIKELLLVISSEDERIQNLPWEMVLPKLIVGDGYDLPKNNFGLIRSRVDTLQQFNRQGPTVETAPLKMLFIPALPENLPERSKLLEIENEQRKIIEAVRGLEANGNQQPRLVMEILDCANLEEIKDAIEKRSHDIVHISGHGSYIDAIKSGVLYLENEDGDEEQITGNQLGVALRQFSSIKLLVLSACETAVGGTVGSTAEQMAAVGLPAVLAMRFSVTDQGARLFAETLYTRLAFGDSLTKSMHDARLALWKYAQKQRNESPHIFTPAEWFTPVLYQNQAIGSLLRTGQYNIDTLKLFYPAITFQAGKHTRLIGEGFIGRKRLLIRLRQCFKQGEHICLHGLGGLGKTTTAEAFADSYRKRNGHDILVFRTGVEIQEAVILDQIFEKWKNVSQPEEFRAKQLRAQLEDSKKSSLDKLQLLLDNCLRGSRTILIFDNFEDVQADQDGNQQQRIVSESLSTFLRYLLENIPSTSHILFTSRYSITDLNDLVTSLAVDKMSYAEQYRYINFSETLRKLSQNEREILDRRIDGHPRALELLEGLLRHPRLFDLAQFNATIGKVETKIFESLLLDHLYSRLNDLEREVFITSSVFFSRSPMAALTAVMNKSPEELVSVLTALQNWSLCFWNEQEQLFEVHALTRTWMRQRQQPDKDQFKEVSYLAGVFFRERSTLDGSLTARVYFEQAEAWEDYENVTFQLENYFRLTGLYPTALNFNQEILSKNISLPTNARAQHNLGLIGICISDYDQALPYLEQSLQTSIKLGDRVGEGNNLNDIGLVYKGLNNLEKALEYFNTSLEIRQQIGHKEGEGITLNNIGTVYGQQGD